MIDDIENRKVKIEISHSFMYPNTYYVYARFENDSSSIWGRSSSVSKVTSFDFLGIGDDFEKRLEKAAIEATKELKKIYSDRMMLNKTIEKVSIKATDFVNNNGVFK